MFNIKKTDRSTEVGDKAAADAQQSEAVAQPVVPRGAAGSEAAPVRKVDPPAPSVLAPGAVLQGSIRAPGPLHLQGTVEGDVQAPHVSLGEQGTLRGRLKCGHFVLDGHMDGEVLCREFSAGETARISGVVRCNVLNLKLGASINADVMIGEEPK